MSFIFKVGGLFFKTDDHLVLFVSFMGKTFNDSPRAIYDYLKSHEEYRNYRCVWAFENPSSFPELNTVRIDSAEYFKTALKAKYWITNTNIERGLRFKKNDQVYLNTWHGIALKYIGNDVKGRNDFNFNNVDYLCVSGNYEERIFKSAFKAEESSYLRCGLPRNEELWHPDLEKAAEIKKQLGIPAHKKVILYAPTWRESKDKGLHYSFENPIHIDEWKKELGQEYSVLFRAHHQTNEVMGFRFDDFLIDVSTYLAVNDLMIAADILITDYSAIAFDYSILCRPIFCYAYDYEEYLSERGTYFDIDEKYPNKSCRTERELLDRITNMDYEAECRNTRRFRDDFIQYGENATEICVRSVFGGKVTV